MRRWIAIWKPERYHGPGGRKRNFFEGWYFKSVDRRGKHAVAVIPGVSLGGSTQTAHAFIQFVEAGCGRAGYFRFPLSEFRSAMSDFRVAIGPNRFSLDRLILDLADGPRRVRGELRFSGMIPWPVRFFSPGVMGWYAFVPFMECYHGVLSFDHAIDGFLEIDGHRSDFSGGRGYIEKDWGRSMPAAWIWMQSNHFLEQGVSLFGSIAKIPWRGNFFTGFIFGFLHHGRVHRFATYTGARIVSLAEDGKRISLVVADRRHGLEISADRRAGVDLPAPLLGEMSARVRETLRSSIAVRFFQRSGSGRRETIFSGTGEHAGLEFVGDIAVLKNGLPLKNCR